MTSKKRQNLRSSLTGLKRLDIESIKYRMVSLGRPAVFFLPSLKINNPENRAVLENLHLFLTEEFGGYTVEKGNISGFWQDKAKIDYTEHVKYTVAFKGKERIPKLANFLVKLAKELSEDAIYIETGEDSWLIYPK